MNKKELERGEIITNILKEKLPNKNACSTMGLSLRQIYRLLKKYKDEGLKGLAHKNRGKSSNRKISSNLRSQVLELINKNYSVFGPQLIKEQLEDGQNLYLLI